METRQAILLFVADCRDRGLSQSTIRGYQSHLKYFELAFPELPTEFLAINRFLTRDIRKKSARYNIRKTLLALYKFLERQEISPNPIPKLKIGRPRKISTKNPEKVGRGGQTFPLSESSSTFSSTRQLIENFLQAKRMAPATVRWYQDMLYPFAVLEPEYPQEPEPYRTYLFNLVNKINPRTREKVSERYQINAYRALKTFCRWCWREYDLPDYFSAAARRRVESPTSARSRHQLPQTLTNDEVKRLYAATDNFIDKTILKTLIFTGIRVGELCSLTSSGIAPGNIQVYGKTGWHSVPITPDLYNDLILLAQEVKPGQPIFRNVKNESMNPDGVGQRVRKCMLRAGITGKKLGPHTLRHTFGRVFLESGGDLRALQKLLGHTQISTTVIYSEMSDTAVEQKYLEFGPHRLFEVENEQPASK